jgi:hypothetical protein
MRLFKDQTCHHPEICTSSPFPHVPHGYRFDRLHPPKEKRGVVHGHVLDRLQQVHGHGRCSPVVELLTMATIALIFVVVSTIITSTTWAWSFRSCAFGWLRLLKFQFHYQRAAVVSIYTSSVH